MCGSRQLRLRLTRVGPTVGLEVGTWVGAKVADASLVISEVLHGHAGDDSMTPPISPCHSHPLQVPCTVTGPC